MLPPLMLSLCPYDLCFPFLFMQHAPSSSFLIHWPHITLVCFCFPCFCTPIRSFSTSFILAFLFSRHFLSVAPCPSTRDGRCFNVPRRPPSFGWCSIRSNSQLRTTSTLVAKHKTHLLPRQSQSFCKRQTRLPNHSNLVSLTSGSSRPSPLKLLLQRTSLPFALETSEDVFAGSNHGVVAIVG